MDSNSQISNKTKEDLKILNEIKSHTRWIDVHFHGDFIPHIITSIIVTRMNKNDA